MAGWLNIFKTNKQIYVIRSSFFLLSTTAWSRLPRKNVGRKYILKSTYVSIWSTCVWKKDKWELVR